VGDEPEGINQKGDIVATDGEFEDLVNWHNGTTTTFAVPADSVLGYLSINNQDYVMGTWEEDNPNAPDPTHGFIRSPNGVITTFDPPNSTATIPTALNNANEIVGYYFIGTSNFLGFLRLPECGKGE